MNKYKVEFNLKAQQKGKPKYDFIFGQTENSALEDAGLSREQIVGIYLLSTAEEQAVVPAEVVVGQGPVDFPPPPSNDPEGEQTAPDQGTSTEPVVDLVESIVDTAELDSEPTESPSVQDEPSVGNELSTKEASAVTPELSVNDDLACSGSSEFN